MGLFGDSSTTTDTSDDSTTTATTTTATKTTTPPVVQAVETSDISYPKASQIAQVQDECEGQGITSSDCGHAAKDYLGRNVGIAVGVGECLFLARLSMFITCCLRSVAHHHFPVFCVPVPHRRVSLLTYPYSRWTSHIGIRHLSMA